MTDQPTARELIDHLEAMVSDKRDDPDVLRVAIGDLINVVSLLETQIRRLDERLA